MICNFDCFCLNESNKTELNKIIKKCYKIIEPFTKSQYSDMNWSNFKDAVDSLKQIENVTNIISSAGEYKNFVNARSLNYNNPAYREYDITLETPFGNIKCSGKCHSAGTEEDPFKRYDMTFTFWAEK